MVGYFVPFDTRPIGLSGKKRHTLQYHRQMDTNDQLNIIFEHVRDAPVQIKTVRTRERDLNTDVQHTTKREQSSAAVEGQRIGTEAACK